MQVSRSHLGVAHACLCYFVSCSSLVRASERGLNIETPLCFHAATFENDRRFSLLSPILCVENFVLYASDATRKGATTGMLLDDQQQFGEAGAHF